jgi:hypothetical protein
MAHLVRTGKVVNAPFYIALHNGKANAGDSLEHSMSAHWIHWRPDPLRCLRPGG